MAWIPRAAGKAGRVIAHAITGATVEFFVNLRDFPNGSTWTLVGTDTITLPDTVLIGLAAHSHTTTSLATAKFDNVSTP